MKRLLTSVMIAVSAVFVFAGAQSGNVSPAAAQADLVAYTMVDQWPEREAATTGLFQDPVDLEVAADGRVYIADAGINGIHTLLATGTFTVPFGVTGGFPYQLGRVGRMSIGPDPDAAEGEASERLYVLDRGTDRVVVFSLDGTFVAAWDDVNAASLAASSDGRVYALDRETSQVRVLNASTGEDLFAFGERGTEKGQFSNFTDVSVSPDGRVLAVGDMRGQRVQLFDMATDEELGGDTPPPAFDFRREYDFTAARFNKGDYTCRSNQLSALGDDMIFSGESTTACLIDNMDVDFAISLSANNKTICRETVIAPKLRADTTQYFAVATYDPNSGNCSQKRAELATSRVVVRYADTDLGSVRTVWHAEANDEVQDPAMFVPRRLSMPAPNQIFVEDSSSKLRFYDTEGDLLSTVARDSSVTDAGTDTMFYRLLNADGTDALDEVFAAYVRIQRSGDQFSGEMGVGRYRNVERNGPSGPVDIVEPVWTYAMAQMGGRPGGGGQGGGPGSGRRRLEIPFLSFNPVSNELLLLTSESVEQQRSVDMKIMRFRPDGDRLPDAWDIPDDGQVNPYVDMTVGPDGRIFLLDDFTDTVRIFTHDGQPAGEVPVSADARAIAGGPESPDGSVFALREVGAIERYADDGTITARLDGRPLAFSDPTTLTDLVVDADGRVYVADGQSSLISVFEPTDDEGVLPVPDDGTCLFRGTKTADPTTLQLGDSTTVSLNIEGLCAVQEEPSDIVVVVPYFGQLQQGVDPSSTVMTQLLQLAARVDFEKHRMGIVSYYQTTNVELELTHDGDAYDLAARDVRRYDPPNQDVKARLKNAMQTAADLYDEDDGRRKVMLLLNPMYCDPAMERFPGQCTGYPPAEETAAAIRDSGVTIVSLGSFGASNLVSSDEDMLRQPAQAHRRMVNYQLPENLVNDLVLTDIVPGNMTIDEASISAGGSWTKPLVNWISKDIDWGGAEWSFDLEPQVAGTWPTNVSALATLMDGWGHQHKITFPVPQITVIGPDPTPPPNTPVPTPTTSPTAGPTPVPEAIYLPWLARNLCMPSLKPLDLAIVVDASGSMEGAKLDAAKASVQTFLDSMNLRVGRDQAALVSFAEQAELVQDLTADRAVLAAAVDSIESTSGTRIDRGLVTALDVLSGLASRDDAAKVVVLLSDGVQVEEPETAYAAGRLAEELGVEVFTIGLGEDADTDMLASIATDVSHFTYAPSGADLDDVYARIAASLDRCP